MTPVLIIGGVTVAGLILSGKAKTMNANQWLALVVALMGANFLRGGNWMMGGAMIAGAAFLNGRRIFGPGKSGWAKPDKATVRKAHDFELDRARALLGLAKDTDRAAIHAAWRTCLAEHHPDRGGDEELARQINRARDILMEQRDAQNS